jgi:predicted outer membrane protein
MKQIFWAPVLLAVALAGCATQAQAPRSAMLSETDLAALTSAYQLLSFDMAECTVVQKQDPGPVVRAVATQICADAQHYRPLLDEIAARHDVTLPNTLRYDLEAQYVTLSYRPSPNLAVNYLNDQIGSHEQALAVFRYAADTSADPDIKALYQNAVPVVERNLVSLRQALAALPPQ